MRLVIVGVGQMYDLDAHEMRNHLQVRGPAGLQTVFTDEATVQQLLSIVEGYREPLADGQERMVDSPYPTKAPYGPGFGPPIPEVGEKETAVNQYRSRSRHQADDIPDGAAVFGGGEPESTAMVPEPVEPVVEDGSPEGLRKRVRARARSRGKRASIKDVVQSYHDDDSGVAVHDVPSDEKGFPIIPGGLPDSTMEDEDDPGEAGQI